MIATGPARDSVSRPESRHRVSCFSPGAEILLTSDAIGVSQPHPCDARLGLRKILRCRILIGGKRNNAIPVQVSQTGDVVGGRCGTPSRPQFRATLPTNQPGLGHSWRSGSPRPQSRKSLGHYPQCGQSLVGLRQQLRLFDTLYRSRRHHPHQRQWHGHNSTAQERSRWHYRGSHGHRL
jgi:hypothetical protein